MGSTSGALSAVSCQCSGVLKKRRGKCQHSSCCCCCSTAQSSSDESVSSLRVPLFSFLAPTEPTGCKVFPLVPSFGGGSAPLPAGCCWALVVVLVAGVEALRESSGFSMYWPWRMKIGKITQLENYGQQLQRKKTHRLPDKERQEDEADHLGGEPRAKDKDQRVK